MFKKLALVSPLSVGKHIFLPKTTFNQHLYASDGQKRSTPTGLEPAVFAMFTEPESNALPLGHGATLSGRFRCAETVVPKGYYI
jgi:hypothetical protein